MRGDARRIRGIWSTERQRRTGERAREGRRRAERAPRAGEATTESERKRDAGERDGETKRRLFVPRCSIALAFSQAHLQRARETLVVSPRYYFLHSRKLYRRAETHERVLALLFPLDF